MAADADLAFLEADGEREEAAYAAYLDAEEAAALAGEEVQP